MSNNHKGIDDLLAAGRSPQRLRGAAVEDFFRRMRAPFTAVPSSIVPTTAPSSRTVSRERPAFPVDVFPAAVARFARQIAAAMGCPVDFAGVGVLVTAGAAIGAARSIHVKGGWFEKPGMYAAIVAEPGQAKTPALKAVMNPIYEEQDRLAENYKAEVRRYKQAKEEWRHNPRSPSEDGDSLCDERPTAPVEPLPLRHLFVSDTTIEALGVNLESSRKGVLVFRDEVSGWVASMNQYRHGADRQFFLSAWSGEMVKVDRKSQTTSIVIPHPFLSVLGGIQPDLLGQLEAEGHREDGFLHRILFSYPAGQPFQNWSDQELDEELQQEWSVVLNRLLGLEPARPEGSSERPRVIHFSDDGWQAFKTFINELAVQMNTGDAPPHMLGAAAKLRSYCARFALTIHELRWAANEFEASWGEGTVDAEDVARAVRLCRYFEQHAAIVHGHLKESDDDKKVATLVAWMRRRGLVSCTARDICRSGLAGTKRARVAQEIMAAAVDMDIGEWADPGNLNHRSRRFRLYLEPASPPDNPTTTDPAT